jgi:hypothetical protein
VFEAKEGDIVVNLQRGQLFVVTHHTFYNDKFFRSPTDAELLAFRFGIKQLPSERFNPHIGQQQRIPATACSKAGSNISIRTS